MGRIGILSILIITSLMVSSSRSFAQFGCGDISLEDAEGNSMRIVDVSPNLSDSLIVGQEVDLNVQVDYKVVETNAAVTISVLKGESNGAYWESIISSKTIVTDSNIGAVSVKQSFKVPITESIILQGNLMKAGAGRTCITDMRAFKVLSNGEKPEQEAAPDVKKERVIYASHASGSQLSNLVLVPDESTVLNAGDVIKFMASVDYETDKVPARITMAVQKTNMTENPRDMLISYQSASLNEYSGNASLADAVIIPEVDSILVVMSLQVEEDGLPKPQASIHKFYRVEVSKD
ncbi:MAG: hypothetical protein KC897_12915 [Candidatus Omnitrophica bacterium]|nr:hypothetical protein [Candidatus Omnitrophota bacterium]MCB9720896.1 hypothetical protein [Candidatus Omnitrophota bacterium]